jgi:ketosteroid isomerase-like protein
MSGKRWPRHGVQGAWALVAVLIMSAGTLSGTARAAQAPGMEQRLQALQDYIEIEQLLMRYAAAYNTGDADAYVATFTPDGSLELRRDVDQPAFLGPFTGREALRKQWFPEGAVSGTRKFGPMRHVTTNHEINVSGDTATVRAFFMEVVSNGPNIPPGSKPPTIHAMGRYEDQLVKLDGRWLFKRRVVITDLNTKWEP